MPNFEVEVRCTLTLTNSVFVFDAEDEIDVEERIKDLVESGKLRVKWEVERPGDLECDTDWEVVETDWEVDSTMELDD